MTHVLLVEDNSSVLQGITFELEMRGYQVSIATNGQGALDFLEKAPDLPDIIVSDIAMPILDGYQLLEIVQSREAWLSIPFIFLSAYSSEADIRIGKQLGVDDYLVKPFKPDELVIAMENKLRRVAQWEDRAERKLSQIKDELMNLISHELRTPLTAIYGGTEFLSEVLAELPDTMAANALRIIQSGTKRLNRLVNQVLLLAQIDSGFLEKQLKANPEKCDIWESLQLGSQDAQKSMPHNKASIDIQTPTNKAKVLGSGSLLAQAFGELIRNGLNFSPSGGCVQVYGEVHQGSAIIIVEDRGVGIPEADLSLIWDRFTQINRVHHEQQGAGLGLSIVQEIIKLHGGECLIESKLGEGTRVMVTLPITEGAS